MPTSPMRWPRWPTRLAAIRTDTQKEAEHVERSLVPEARRAIQTKDLAMALVYLAEINTSQVRIQAWMQEAATGKPYETVTPALRAMIDHLVVKLGLDPDKYKDEINTALEALTSGGFNHKSD